MKKSLLMLLMIVVALSACEQLASLGNTRTEIVGDWQKMEMSFPGHRVWAFSDGVIEIDGLERGSYTFRGHSKIDVVVDDEGDLYELDFPDDKTMVWYRDDGSGRERVSEFTRLH